MADSIEYRKVKVAFKLVFLSVFGLVLLLLGTSIYFGVQPTLTDGGKQVLETSLTLLKIGVGSVLGLLGGKVIP
ncbi:MAG: hypothetical protein ABL952_01200 [Pyrinomonadaceae bacterium]